MNVLIISGHADIKTSVANKTIVEELKKQLPEAEIRELSELYPDFKIDVAAEQEALLKADVIVWQFPIFWYTTPAILRKWQDDVYVHGFAHGSKGQLRGKKFLVSFTTGAPEMYYNDSEQGFGELSHFTKAYESTAKLCGFDYQGAMYLTGVGYTARDNEEAIQAQKEQARQYAAQLVARINEIAG